MCKKNIKFTELIIFIVAQEKIVIGLLEINFLWIKGLFNINSNKNIHWAKLLNVSELLWSWIWEKHLKNANSQLILKFFHSQKNKRFSYSKYFCTSFINSILCFFENVKCFVFYCRNYAIEQQCCLNFFFFFNVEKLFKN